MSSNKKKVLKYLRYTVDYGLHYTGYPIILERIMILIGYPTLRILNPQIDMSSHLVEQLCHENTPNKHILLDSWWNQSILILIKLERKPNEFQIS